LGSLPVPAADCPDLLDALALLPPGAREDDRPLGLLLHRGGGSTGPSASRRRRRRDGRGNRHAELLLEPLDQVRELYHRQAADGLDDVVDAQTRLRRHLFLISQRLRSCARDTPGTPSTPGAPGASRALRAPGIPRVPTR